MSALADPARDRSARVDFVLGALCAVALVGVLYAAFRETPRTGSRASGPVLGKLAYEENEVRRRADGTLAWQPLHVREPLFDRDAVFVGSQSRAVIELDDGARIDVSEGALVVVHRPETPEAEAAPVSVEIVRGAADAHAGVGGLTVHSGDTRVAATPGSTVRVRTDRRRGAQVDVSAGKAVVAGRGNRAVALAAGTRARVEPGGATPTQQRLSVELVRPAASETIYSADEASEVNFAWSAPADAKGCRAEVSDDPSFERVIARVEGEAGAGVLLPKPGAYLWRVRCDGGSAPYASEDRLLHLVHDRAPVPLHPVAGSVIPPDARGPVTISWTEVDGSSGYELELQSGTGAPRRETPWSAAFRVDDPLAEGEWCYRVRAQPVGRQTPWSERTCFHVGGDGVLPAPELLAPTREPLKKGGDKRGALDLLWNVVGGVAHADGPKSAIVLRWRSIPGADSYILEIAEDPNFETKVLQEKVRHTWFKWPIVLRREYFWRVRAVDARGREGRMSAVERLASEIVPIGLEAPTGAAAWECAERPPRIPLRWSGPKVARTYRVEVATDAAFRDVVFSRELQGTDAVFEPTLAGEYHWRVSASDLEGQPLPASAPSRFRVVATAPVTASQRARLVAGESGATAALSWSARPVKAYELQVASDASFANVVVRRIVHDQAGARVRIDRAGRFHWRVRGVDPETAWSPGERLVVHPERPTALSPEDGATLAVSDALGAAELRWTGIAGSRAYELELRTDSGQVIRKESNEITARVDGLPTARFFWRVRSLHKAGLESDWSEPRSFVLEQSEPVPTVERPAREPASDAPRPVETSSPPKRAPAAGSPVATVHLGASVGFFHNLGRVQSPTGTVELGWRPAAWGRRFGAALAVGYFRANDEVTDAGGLSARANLDAIPVTLTASWLVPAGALDLVFSAGPSWSLTHSAVQVSPGDSYQMTRTGFGFVAHAGVERKWGPGAAFAQAGWLQLPKVDGIIEARASGLSIQAGYRLGVW